MFQDIRNSLARALTGNRPFQSTPHLGNFTRAWNLSKPEWIGLSNPEDFENAIRFNPIVKACINLIANAAANGVKYLEDVKTGERIEWTDQRAGVQNAKRLFTGFPNPLQSREEFEAQKIFYLKTFGNAFVYLNSPEGFDVDITTVQTLFNLHSRFMNVKKTGKIYDQTTIEGIVSEYALTNVSPIKKFEPKQIIHLNEVNISSFDADLMGISKLEVLRNPITNIQLAFDFMNSLMVSRGTGGIISPATKDANGTIVPTKEERKKLNKTFKADYGFLNNQSPFLMSPIPIEFTKTVISSKDLGLFDDFNSNSQMVSNEFGVPNELIKTYTQGATFENQGQSVKRLYQETVIPMVQGHDKSDTEKLNCEKYGFIIKTDWSHIAVLQDNFKDKAVSVATKGKTAEAAYNNRVITLNQYLQMIELPTIKGGDTYKPEETKEIIV